MALSGKAHGKDLVFKLDNQSGVLKDLSAYVRSVTGLPGEIELGDVTVGGGSTGYSFLPGLQKADFSIECVFDDAVDSAWDVVSDFDSDTNTRSFEYGPAGETAGYAKINGECRILRVPLPANAPEPLLFTVELKLDGGRTIGVWT